MIVRDDCLPVTSNDSLTDEIISITHRLKAVLEKSTIQKQTSVTVSYAQSIDGCIAVEEGSTTKISNKETQTLCHHVRSLHQGILVGINTVKIDNPLLNVRLIPGVSPRPIILDSRLSIPDTASILKNGFHPIIATTQNAPATIEKHLVSMGAEVLRIGSDSDIQIDLPLLFEILREKEIYTIMVEGGAKVNTEIFRQKIFNQMLITISPKIYGGKRSVGDLSGLPGDQRPFLKNVYFRELAGDLLIYGEKK